jgi:hypothetical protein
MQTNRNRRLLVALVILTTLGGISDLSQADNSPATPSDRPDQVDPIVKASAYGDKLVWSYSDIDDHPLPWTLFKPNDFATIPVDWNSDGVVSVGNVPAPGVHPRIYFSPEDLPAIRKRLKETRAGQEAYKNVLSYANALKLTYDEKADYAQPDWMKGCFGIHGRVPLFRIGGYGKREDYYNELANGQKPTKDFPFFQAATAEAFRCLIENDAEGAKKLATATVNAVKFEQARCAAEDKPVAPGEPPRPSTSRSAACALGVVYDFIYNWMTPEQRQVVHDELATLSAWDDNYGTFNNADSSRSNWATFSYWVFDLMAIEGEPGFNDLKFRGLYRGWRNFLTTSFFKSGAVYEGEGKLLLGLDAIIAFDRCASKYGLQPLASHPTPRHYYGDYLVNTILPSRQSFVVFDILGTVSGGVTTPGDVVVAKYLYPHDKKIDLVYRNVVSDDYTTLPNRLDNQWNNVILCAVCATDYDPDNSPQKQALPLSFFCGQRSVMLARSSWDKDADLVTMHVRGASGGHPYRDRNGIMLAGRGRPWVTIPGHNGEENGSMCNTVLIDERDQSNTTPARVVDYQDGPLATFMVGDAKYCWDWVWSSTHETLDPKVPNQPDPVLTESDVIKGNVRLGAGWKLVDQCFNNFAYTKIKAASYDRPLKLSRDWIKVDGAINAIVRQWNTPVLKSFRTTGLVRGDYPYVIVVDDIQRNCLPNRYDWHLNLMPDIEQVKSCAGTQPGDIVMAGHDSIDTITGQIKDKEPGLMIRILEEDGQPSAPTLEWKNNDKTKINLFTISTEAVSPNFKILLYPFRMGDPLPMTTWNATHTTAEVKLGAQDDQIAFTPSDSGKTNLTITRGTHVVVHVDAPVPSLNDPDSDLLTAKLNELPKKIDAAKAFDPASIPGLVASWKLDQPINGQFPADQEGIPAIPVGGATMVDSPMGPAARFDKDGGQTQLDLKDKFQNAFTISFWVKSDPVPNGNIVKLGSNDAFGMSVIQNDIWMDALRDNRLGGSLSSSPITGWTHFVATKDSQNFSLYRDGMLVETIPSTLSIAAPSQIKLGGNAYGSFHGEFRDVRIYNTAIDADTVQKLYLKTYCFTPKKS